MAFVRPKVWGHKILLWDFDGSTWITRGAGLTGAADSKTGIFSCWLITTDSDSVIYSLNGGKFSAQIVSGKLQLQGKNSGGTDIMRITSTTSVNDGSLHHVVGTWNTGNINGYRFYLDGVEDRNSGADLRTDQNIDYTETDGRVGAFLSDASPFTGQLGQLYIEFGDILDIDTPSNLAKFIDTNGDPVDMGEDGSTPTSSSPIMYMLMDGLSVLTNDGTGGDFEDEGGEATDGGDITPNSNEVPDATDFNAQLDENFDRLHDHLTDYRFLVVKRGENTTVNNSTTLTNITDLNFEVKQNETWMFFTFYRVLTTAAADVKFGITVPSGAAGRHSAIGGGTRFASGSLATALSGTVSSTDGRPFNHYGVIRVGDNPGTVQFQFAQDSLDANDTTISNINNLVAFRIA